MAKNRLTYQNLEDKIFQLNNEITKLKSELEITKSMQAEIKSAKVKDKDNYKLLFDQIHKGIAKQKGKKDVLHKTKETQSFFFKRLALVLEAINELTKIKSFDELCRRSVELTIETLGFDRVGLCFISEDQQTVLGTYGTDEAGYIRDEKHLRRPITETPTIMKLLEKHEAVIFFEDEVLLNDKLEQVGIGNHAVARLWNGENVIGIYAVDNLINKNPITDEDLKILEIYGTAMGHLFTLKQAEEELRESERHLLIKNQEYEAINEKLKKINKELLKAKEYAEKSDRLKTVFLQNMSHEIRTPMNAIIGFSDLLAESFNDKNELLNCASIIKQRSSDLLELIDDILDLSKIETGQLPINIEECNLIELFNDLYVFFINHRQKIKKTHIELEYMPPNIPELNLISIDKSKLKQIFINLIYNAFKFTNKGKITFGCETDEKNNITFYVSDTGIGIPKNKHDLIFERFMQIESQNGIVHIGTGLGLAIVKGLVELLGGEITLKSAVDKGTTFYFSLPYKLVVSKNYKFTKHLPDSEVIWKEYCLLIVEDEPYNTEYLTKVLTKTKINILTVINAHEAIELVESGKPIDIILMDVKLPGINGLEATTLIKKKRPDIKIIAQTAYATTNDYRTAIDAGCDDYISKPIKKELLITKINEQLML